MITVELREAPHGEAPTYQRVATLQVDDQGTYRVEDPAHKLLTELHVLVRDETAEHGLRQVTLEDDAATWARNLHTIYRGGHMVAVVTEDTGAPESRY